MANLGALRKLLGLQVTQAQPTQLGNNTPQAQIYNANPQDPRVAHMDPAQFGYPADNGDLRVAQAGGTMLQQQGQIPYGVHQSPSGLAQSPQEAIPQGGAYNPGFTPLQDNRPLNYRHAPQPGKYIF